MKANAPSFADMIATANSVPGHLHPINPKCSCSATAATRQAERFRRSSRVQGAVRDDCRDPTGLDTPHELVDRVSLARVCREVVDP